MTLVVVPRLDHVRTRVHAEVLQCIHGARSSRPPFFGERGEEEEAGLCLRSTALWTARTAEAARSTHPRHRIHLTLARYSCDSAYTVDMQRLLPTPAIHPALARGEGPAIVRIARVAAPEDRTTPPNLATATEAMATI